MTPEEIQYGILANEERIKEYKKLRKDGDKIWHGKLAGKGTHEELMQNCEIYQEIFYSQFPEKKPEGKAVLA